MRKSGKMCSKKFLNKLFIILMYFNVSRFINIMCSFFQGIKIRIYNFFIPMIKDFKKCMGEAGSVALETIKTDKLIFYVKSMIINKFVFNGFIFIINLN